MTNKTVTFCTCSIPQLHLVGCDCGFIELPEQIVEVWPKGHYQPGPPTVIRKAGTIFSSMANLTRCMRERYGSKSVIARVYFAAAPAKQADTATARFYTKGDNS